MGGVLVSDGDGVLVSDSNDALVSSSGDVLVSDGGSLVFSVHDPGSGIGCKCQQFLQYTTPD